jgi:hypothetical protein
MLDGIPPFFTQLVVIILVLLPLPNLGLLDQ